MAIVTVPDEGVFTRRNRQAINDNFAALSGSTAGGTLTSAHLLVGNSSNVATDTAVTGDVTIGNTGVTAIKSSVSLTTPVIGVATGTSLAVTGLLKSSGTAGVGYASGAGGTVTQSTDKSTTVVLNKTCGAITMNNAALNAGVIVSFTLTNSTIAAGDVLVMNHISGGTIGSYTLNAQSAGGSATINVRNATAGNLSEAVVIQFAVIKAVSA